MTGPQNTAIFLIVVAVGLLVWEFWAVYTPGPDDTISAVLRQMNERTGGLLALALAGLYAHVFLIDLLPKSWR